jgi:hypothetical protein
VRGQIYALARFRRERTQFPYGMLERWNRQWNRSLIQRKAVGKGIIFFFFFFFFFFFLFFFFFFFFFYGATTLVGSWRSQQYPSI